MRWDLFCRVIDNYGDIGVCWRLAADLAGRGQPVRLWVDDARALAWMAPDGAQGVTVRGWPDEATASSTDPGDVVVEAFGCDPPPAFVARMRARPAPPVWINLEYLSAEDYVERSHGLRSPVLQGPGAGLDKWFFYPGFTPGTGGLIREPGLIERLAPQAPPVPVDPAEREASVFCYPTPRLERLAQDWPGRLRLAGGCGQGQALARPERIERLPWMDQPGFDRLLWRSALNIVRGEDSLVRALWAARPFVWHIYPQHDDAHHAKLDALLALLLDGAKPAFAAALRRLWHAFNGMGDWPTAWPARPPWQEACERFRARLLAQPDLVTQLVRFATDKAPRRPQAACQD